MTSSSPLFDYITAKLGEFLYVHYFEAQSESNQTSRARITRNLEKVFRNVRQGDLACTPESQSIGPQRSIYVERHLLCFVS